MTLHLRHFSIAAAIVACAGAGLQQARAQSFESPQDFWRSQAPAAQDYGPGDGYDRRGGGALGYQEWPPYQRYDGYGAQRQAPAPHVSVKSPQYYDYRPDRPVKVDLTDVCKLQVAANEAPSGGAPQAGALPETPGAAPADSPATIPGAKPIAPAGLTPPNSFAAACAQSPALGLRVLPQVGKALSAYYGAHPRFIWVADGRVSGKAMAAMAELAASARFGLDPADYKVALPAQDLSGPARDQAMLRFELALSGKALTYVLDARRGRVAPDRISGYHDLPRKQVDLKAALGSIAQATDVGDFLKRQNPDNARFAALAAALQKLRGEARTPRISVPADTHIEPGEKSPRLGRVIAAIVQQGSAELKTKHAAALTQGVDATRYTPDLVALVRDFQRTHGLSADGIVGPNTVAALTQDSAADKTEKIKLAMERLRWLPRHLGTRYVFLNEPSFRVNYIDGGKVALSSAVVIGQKSKQTFFFSDHIKAVEYNPYWNVPRSILINEMLGHLYRDPSYLDRHGYQVLDARGRRISSAAVNWSAVARDHESVDVRQPPGNRNALGRLKIEFPNAHAIYMHDTPEKQLFAHDRRAFSHGCVRLKRPRAMAAALLGTGIDHIDRKIAQGANDSEPVPGDIPVYLAYFTAWPDVNGVVHYYDDVYGRDDHLAEALKKTEAVRGNS